MLACIKVPLNLRPTLVDLISKAISSLVMFLLIKAALDAVKLWNMPMMIGVVLYLRNILAKIAIMRCFTIAPSISSINSTIPTSLCVQNTLMAPGTVLATLLGLGIAAMLKAMLGTGDGLLRNMLILWLSCSLLLII